MVQIFADRAAQLGLVPQLGQLISDEISDVASSPATEAEAGVVLQGEAVADCVPAADGTSAGTALNALLASLRAAGVIAT